MVVSYSCPGCSHSDRLYNYVCSNCRKPNAMHFLGADNHIPFLCINCDANHRDLYCPKCETRISLRFVKVAEVVKEKNPWIFVIIGLVVLLALIDSVDRNKKQSENIPAEEAPVAQRPTYAGSAIIYAGKTVINTVDAITPDVVNKKK